MMEVPLSRKSVHSSGKIKSTGAKCWKNGSKPLRTLDQNGNIRDKSFFMEPKCVPSVPRISSSDGTLEHEVELGKDKNEEILGTLDREGDADSEIGVVGHASDASPLKVVVDRESTALIDLPRDHSQQISMPGEYQIVEAEVHSPSCEQSDLVIGDLRANEQLDLEDISSECSEIDSVSSRAGTPAELTDSLSDDIDYGVANLEGEFTQSLDNVQCSDYVPQTVVDDERVKENCLKSKQNVNIAVVREKTEICYADTENVTESIVIQCCKCCKVQIRVICHSKDKLLRSINSVSNCHRDSKTDLTNSCISEDEFGGTKTERVADTEISNSKVKTRLENVVPLETKGQAECHVDADETRVKAVIDDSISEESLVVTEVLNAVFGAEAAGERLSVKEAEAQIDSGMEDAGPVVSCGADASLEDAGPVVPCGADASLEDAGPVVPCGADASLEDAGPVVSCGADASLEDAGPVVPCDTSSLHRPHPHCFMDNVLKELSDGFSLHKIKGGGILYTRTFYLDTNSMKLLYTGSQKRFRKKPTSWLLSSIEEVREGEKDFSKRLDRHDKYKAFCVILGANHEVLYLLANNYDTRDKWVKGLRYAIQLDQYVKQKENSNIWVRQAFDRADKNSDNRLDLEEVTRLLKSLNADMDKAYVKEMFDAADTNRLKGEKPTLDREEFVKFYNKLTERPELEELFLKYAKDVGYMTASDLQMFLTQEQREPNVTLDRCKEIIVVYEPQPEMKKTEKMSLIGFRSFLTSQQQHLFNRYHRRVYQDMTQPMTNYFISSSHNTYLAEDQLKGPSRVECYISALKRGCRCVELDCWDGSDGEPVIYHGYTLTSKILYQDVIRAIKDYAFVTSPYPVTLSIENHCSVDQQTKMAEYMSDILGDLLYVPTGVCEKPPSPHELKNKVIVKGKRIPNTFASTTTETVHELSDDEDESAEANETVRQDKINKKQKLKLSLLLSKVVGMKSAHFKDINTPLSGNETFTVVSLAEKKIGKLLDSELESVARYTRSTMIRTYPAGTRTDSSNYNPMPMWCGGCQIVALNFQTGGEDMQLLHGKFLDNGNSGYVLKPPCFQTDDDFLKVLGCKASTNRKQLTVKVISGFQLPKPKDSKKGEVIDPFLKIEIHGITRDTQDQRTHVIDNNGFNPIWNKELTFAVDIPEIALVRFVVYDKDRYVDDFIGYYVVPFNSLVQGYRHFPLFDKNGDQFEQGVMFVNIQITDLPPQ